ncbi:pentapeptide repeat-containing protein [Streptomyces sp. SLBN-31]|uniref:pentapeptide repeat-containing protein n=1 Tax=Streptomyces sp. SLBN-31 TaxID=2768444 RepID=UPI00135935DA
MGGGLGRGRRGDTQDGVHGGGGTGHDLAFRRRSSLRGSSLRGSSLRGSSLRRSSLRRSSLGRSSLGRSSLRQKIYGRRPAP